MRMADRLAVAVFGGSGYAGAELLRLLAGHERMQVVAAAADSQAENASLTSIRVWLLPTQT